MNTTTARLNRYETRAASRRTTKLSDLIAGLAFAAAIAFSAAIVFGLV